MAVQTATTGNLESASNIVIERTLFTLEHNMPCAALVTHMSLGKGQKQRTVPKAARATASDLVDGVDLVSTQDIGLTTVDLTAAEVGLKFILTENLIEDLAEDAFAIIGHQAGMAMAVKMDTDIIALFSALNGGTTFGADNALFTLTNAAACIAKAKANKMGNPLFIVHHPNAVYEVIKSAAVTPSATYGIPAGLSERLLKDFYRYTFNQVPIFEDGNIAKIGSTDSGYGVIASKGAMVVLQRAGMTTKKDEDISLRAWEVVTRSRYGAFELDDSYGAPLRYEIPDPATS